MFTKLLENYRQKVREVKFVSQLATFVISIFLFLSLFDLVKFLEENSKYLDEFLEESKLISALAFQVTILLVFIARFILHLFKPEKFFWTKQILWIVGLIFLASYWFYSRPTENSFGVYSTYTSVFIYASRSFDSLGSLYLFLSPIKQLIVLISSSIKEK